MNSSCIALFREGSKESLNLCLPDCAPFWLHHWIPGTWLFFFVQLGLHISDGFALRDYNVLMLDLLQLSLKHLFNICSQKLSLKTVLMLADQLGLYPKLPHRLPLWPASRCYCMNTSIVDTLWNFKTIWLLGLALCWQLLGYLSNHGSHDVKVLFIQLFWLVLRVHTAGSGHSYIRIRNMMIRAAHQLDFNSCRSSQYMLKHWST
jgi:hypothetical protein